MRQRRRSLPIRMRLLGAWIGSALLHAAAGAAAMLALAWRATPLPPGPAPALQVVWLAPAEDGEQPPATTEAPAGAAAPPAPLGPARPGMEPEDALATQLGALLPMQPAEPMPMRAPAALPPLPIPMAEPPPVPDPASLFAPPGSAAGARIGIGSAG
ncbi:hypothetical protein CKO45_14990, partial [Paracraurococcus ruber]|nr:hypothetical protein [Paracraurococcus ruber]